MTIGPLTNPIQPDNIHNTSTLYIRIHMMIDEARRQESIRVLGFDPYTIEYCVDMKVITPAMAAYILKWHNFGEKENLLLFSQVPSRVSSSKHHLP